MFEGNTRDNQEVFDYIYQKFVVEEVPQCMHPNESYCCYSPQEEGQIGCAVGCLMSPEDAENIDNSGEKSIASVFSDFDSIYNKYFDEDQFDFLGSLQNMHDVSNGVGHREYKLAVIAETYNLTIPEPA